MMSDSFYTIKEPSEIEMKIKASRFIGRVFSCQSELEAEDILAGIRKKYYDATHHCFAWRIGLEHEQKFRYSDAGEPSGTAGKPIYDRIEGNNLTNLILIVTRYYGGTKLGTGGLTHIYSETAALVIKEAGIVEQFLTEDIIFAVSYPDYGLVERLIYSHNGQLVNRDMNLPIPMLTVRLRLSSIKNFKEKVVDATSGRIKFE
jgi:uncharacterized YigZ family protein